MDNNILIAPGCEVLPHQVMDGQHAVPRLHQAVFEQHPQRDAPPGQQGAPAGAGPQVCLLSPAQLLLVLLSSILHHLWRAGWFRA